jgi:hypothetical protein
MAILGEIIILDRWLNTQMKYWLLEKLPQYAYEIPIGLAAVQVDIL